MPFGVFAETGYPLPGLEHDPLLLLTPEREQGMLAERLAQTRAQSPKGDAAVLREAGNPNELDQVGWGIVFAVDADPKIKEALLPLLALRQQQAGDLYRQFEDASSYQPGESAVRWLDRQGVRMDIVDPYLGIPYYLLLVGSPQQIPFEVQYTLDIYWAVGRLYFEEQENGQHYDQYRQYAESLVAYETAPAVPTTRQIALFAPSHDFDRATQLFVNQVASPLVNGSGAWAPLGQRQRFSLHPYLAEQATKAALSKILRGQIASHPPALLLTGSHGMVFSSTDPRQATSQGALVCQNWEGYGSILPDHWFAASDVPQDANVHGLIHFCFACYSAGYPQFDTYAPIDAPYRAIATQDTVARLPQQLLSHPNGSAIAVLGHIDRAWAYSFQSRRGGSQTQGFRDVLGGLLLGDRIGQATDQFNLRWTALSSELLDCLRQQQAGVPIEQQELANRWVARDDAKNYVILGDPAARLRVEDLPELEDPRGS